MDPCHPAVPNVTGTVAARIQVNTPDGFGVLRMIKKLQPDPGGVAAEEGKVHAATVFMGTHR
jgi:hypothetical protein